MQNAQVEVKPGGFFERQVGATQARSQLKDILNQVQHQGEKVIIERHGQPAVAVVPIGLYQNWKQQRQQLKGLIAETQQANQDADPDQVMADVLAAQQAVRATSEKE